MARTMKLDHLDVGTRDVWGLEKTPATQDGESFYVEYDFDLPKVPACNTPMVLCDDPHELPRRRTAARTQLDEFLRGGTGTNHCNPDDGDSAPAAGPGICSYPSLSGCDGETDEDAQALCTPGGLP